jgi:hypothetical protein
MVVVGVKEGGPNHLKVELPLTAGPVPANWDLYETTRELDCQRVGTVPVRNGVAEIELPGEVVFTLVADPGKTE